MLAGLFERVTFHNAETGSRVLRVKARGQRDLATVVGHAASISPDEWVQMSGMWGNDRTHGPQFKAAFLKATPPTTLEGIGKYLGSGLIRGIGPVCARKLVRAFGEWTSPLPGGSPDGAFSGIALGEGASPPCSGLGIARLSIPASGAERRVAGRGVSQKTL